MFKQPTKTLTHAAPTATQRWVTQNAFDALKEALVQENDNELPLKSWPTSHEYISVRLKSQLHDRILQDDEKSVAALITRYPESLHQTYRGFTPLYLAVSQGNRQLVEYLLHEGADLWQPQDRDNATLPTALIEEILRKFRQNSHSPLKAQPYLQLLQYLLLELEIITEEQSISDIVRACINVKYAQEQMAITHILCATDNSSQEEAENDRNAAYTSVDVAWAASQNRGKVALFLLALGGQVEGKYQGKTALAWAADHNDSETVMALLDAGASPMRIFQGSRDHLTEAEARLVNVQDTLRLNKEESQRWEGLQTHIESLRSQQQYLMATVETQQAILIEHQNWLKEYQSRGVSAFKNTSSHFSEKIQQFPYLSLFHSTIEFYLSNILLATKALASGKIAHQKNKQNEVVSFLLPLIGESVPFPGVGAFMQVLEWGTSQALARRQEKRTRHAAQPLQTVGMIDHIANNVATYLTRMFASSLQEIARLNPSRIEETTTTALGMGASEEKWREASSGLEKEKRDEAIQKLGQCAVARVVSFLRNRALDKTSALNVSEQLALSVLYYTRNTGTLPFKSTPIVRFNRSGQKKMSWTDEGIFQRSWVFHVTDEEKSPLFHTEQNSNFSSIPGREINQNKYPPCALPAAWADALKAIYAQKVLKEAQRKVIRRKAGKQFLDETKNSNSQPEESESSRSQTLTSFHQNTPDEPTTEKSQASTLARLGLFQANAPATQREWQVQKETLAQQNQALTVLQQQFQQAESTHAKQHEETKASMTALASQLRDLCTQLQQGLPSTTNSLEQRTAKR